MQSALSECNWPCQNCFSQTVSSSRLAQTAARSPIQETQLAKGGWRHETGRRKRDKDKAGNVKRSKTEGLVWIIGFLSRFFPEISRIYKVFKPLFIQFCSFSVLMLYVYIRSVCVCVCVCALLLCAVNQISCLSQSHMFPITMTNQLTSHFPTHTCTVTHLRSSTHAHTQRGMMGDG